METHATPLTRRSLLAGVASLPLALEACAQRSAERPISVGSKNFTEELIVGHMYAQLLEHAGYPVTRKLNLGGVAVAMAAMQRGDIDLYPEYTGTGLVVQLKMQPLRSESAVYATVKREYQRRYKMTWLEPAPMDDSQALATTQAISQKYGLRTLSQLAVLAPKLRLGAIPEFVQRPDGLPGLRKLYGGFHFKSVRLFDIGLKYEALRHGDVDVVVAFGTDGQIDAYHLVVLDDDKHLWPPYHIAPVVRDDALARWPKIAPALDALAPHLTDAAVRHLNWEVDGSKRDPADVARDFLKRTGLV
ncbi:MAG TPA: glycine betaine ABC transporter substrate-binding protein [Candidatus Dormibacteraeota bacterium]|nr:glycine betaine ABC transporter substrate-binding protein [Candidatus Dormibacteraeota bacterium]